MDISVLVRFFFFKDLFTCVCMCVFTQESFLLVRGNKIKIWQLSLWLVFSLFHSPVERFGW